MAEEEEIKEFDMFLQSEKKKKNDDGNAAANGR